MEPRLFAAFAAMCLVWGFHFVVLKATIGEDTPPLFYAAMRMSLLALILSPRLRLHKGQMVRIVFAGVCLGGMNYAFMFTAIANTNASVVAIVLESYVPIVMLMSVFFLNEIVGWRRIAGLLAALCGILLIATAKNEDLDLGIAPILGITMALFCAVSEACGAILVKKTKDVKPLSLLAWFSVVGAGVLWTATLLFEDNRMIALAPENRWPFFLALLYSILLASMFGHSTYYWLISKLPVSQISSSTIVATLIAVIASVLFLKEPVTWQLLVGGCLVIVGVWIINSRTTDRAKSAAAAIAPAEN